jgi:hypothetical protein
MKLYVSNIATMVSILGCAIALPMLPGKAAAQAMSPMRGEIRSFTDTFALRVYPANPYEHRIRIEVKVYDQDFHPVNAQVSPATFTLGGRNTRPVTVVVPFEARNSRKIRVCTESIPFPGNAAITTTIKAQVCGKFLGTRVSQF